MTVSNKEHPGKMFMFPSGARKENTFATSNNKKPNSNKEKATGVSCVTTIAIEKGESS